MQFPLSKFKVQLRLAIQRLRLYQAKQESQNSKARRDIAGLLEAGKTESARIRVEGIIREDYNIEAMELVELSCELLIARIGLMEQARALDADDGVSEAAASIIYASTRLDVKELVALRELLVAKYGKDAVLRAMDGKDANVSPRLLLKLAVQAPSQDLVSSYLREIAAAYSVAWRPYSDDHGSDAESGGPPSGAVAEKKSTSEEPEAAVEDLVQPEPDSEKLSGAEDGAQTDQGGERQAGTKDGAQSEDQDTEELPYVPQTLSEDRRANEEKSERQRSAVAVPEQKNKPKGRSPVSATAAGPTVSKPKSKQADDGMPSLEELQQRFEALKRR
ncbi:Vacuolar protein sorting-associated protein ist1 [Coemansia sp. RSA 2399]|nr:Vacuolar protein sorting-associated protein ist1 [Coemansia sp. RSA 2399]KAJ1890265.1 Vacuolar protein sorting-associated protein ist1 [Coemansia sp. IMI 209127]